jgi:hypothetical protein
MFRRIVYPKHSFSTQSCNIIHKEEKPPNQTSDWIYDPRMSCFGDLSIQHISRRLLILRHQTSSREDTKSDVWLDIRSLNAISQRIVCPKYSSSTTIWRHSARPSFSSSSSTLRSASQAPSHPPSSTRPSSSSISSTPHPLLHQLDLV